MVNFLNSRLIKMVDFFQSNANLNPNGQFFLPDDSMSNYQSTVNLNQATTNSSKKNGNKKLLKSMSKKQMITKTSSPKSRSGLMGNQIPHE